MLVLLNFCQLNSSAWNKSELPSVILLVYINFKFTASLNVANLRINLKSLIKLKEFPFAFEVTKSHHQRSDRTGSVLLCQTDQKIKFTLFLGGKQDSCVRAEEKIGGKLYERRGP